MKINIINEQKKIKLPIQKLRKLIKQVVSEESLGFTQINFIYVGDDFIQRINKRFLNHDYPTDVLAFDLSDEIEALDKIAEIYISLDRAFEQAKSYKVSFENEVARLTAHGLLHLAGYKDDTKSAKLNMRRRENYYLRKFGF